jgi:hypothetical protein
MADALKVSPEELTVMLEKHKLTGAAQIDALMKAFDEITGPGGAAYKHAESQLHGLAGIQAMFLGHWSDFQESFGIQLENFISPIAAKIFSILTPATLTHAFDQLTPFVKSFSGAIGSLVDKLQTGRAAEQIKAISGALGSFFSKMFGTGSFANFFKEVEDPISGIHTVMTATGKAWTEMASTQWAQNITGVLAAIRATVEFISKHFEFIKNTMILIGLALTGAKLLEIAGGVVRNVQTLAGAIFNVGRATINVAAGTTTTGAGGIGGSVLKNLPWLTLGGTAAAVAIARQIAIEGYKNLPPGYSLTAESVKRQDVSAAAANLEKLKDQQSLSHNVSDAQIAAAQKQLDSAQAALSEYLKIKDAASQTATKMSQLPGYAEAFISKIQSGINSIVVTAQAGAVPAVSPPPAKHAAGGIFVRPHLGLIAERGPEAIIPLGGRKGSLGGISFSVQSSPTIHLGAGAGTSIGDVETLLKEHARNIAEEVRRIFEIDSERAAAV